MPPLIRTPRKQALLNQIFWFNQYLIEQAAALTDVKLVVLIKNIIYQGQDLHRAYAYAYDNDHHYQTTLKALGDLQMALDLSGIDYRAGMEATMSINGYTSSTQTRPADYVKSNPNLARCNHIPTARERRAKVLFNSEVNE